VTTLIHITDPHFGSKAETYNLEKIKSALIEKVNNIKDEKILIISGDITFQGLAEGYIKAQTFFSDIINECSINKKHVIACPGNHDIRRENKNFESFDSFIYGLRKDDRNCVQERAENIIYLNDTAFLIANSSHHLDHRYGLISNTTIKKIKQEEEKIKKSAFRVFITHHHLLNIYEKDTSTIRNAHELIHTLDAYNFDYYLHGHQHSSSDASVGKNCVKVIAGRSFNFHDTGYQNGFNTIALESGRIQKFIIMPDEKPGRLSFEEISNEI
jgi:3',5'-cyclic AMP phosphodiesterase CpdA